MESVSPGSVLIIIVNWNGWRDTIECLESLLRIQYPHFKVVVCDNLSADGSVDKVLAWAEGGLAASASNPALAHLSCPPVLKPISVELLKRGDAWGGACDLTMVQVGDNLGFARANNVALRFLLKSGQFKYAWLLNNDTVVCPNTLTALVKRFDEVPGTGLCGSQVLFYRSPELVQAHGGSTYNPVTARNRHIGECSAAASPVDTEEIQRKMAYVSGASMLVSREFVEQIGMMNEEYFLYYEEIDWAMRARGKFDLAYAPESIVYHKQGASIGSSSDSQEKLASSDYYSVRNQLKLTSRYYPQYLPFAGLTILGRLLKRILRLEWTRSKAVIHGIRDFLYPQGP